MFCWALQLANMGMTSSIWTTFALFFLYVCCFLFLITYSLKPQWGYGCHTTLLEHTYCAGKDQNKDLKNYNYKKSCWKVSFVIHVITINVCCHSDIWLGTSVCWQSSDSRRKCTSLMQPHKSTRTTGFIAVSHSVKSACSTSRGAGRLAVSGTLRQKFLLMDYNYYCCEPEPYIQDAYANFCRAGGHAELKGFVSAGYFFRYIDIYVLIFTWLCRWMNI